MTEFTSGIGPDFMVLGGQRSGTTWLSHVLRQHPGVYSQPIKEIHYWDSIDPTHYSSENRRYEKLTGALRSIISGKGWGDILWYSKYFLPKMDDGWYHNLFKRHRHLGLVCGDITPSYALLSEPLVSHISKACTELKVVYIARDPVMRSWSHLTRRLAKKQGISPGDVSVSEYLEAVRNVPTIVEKSSHSTIVKKWKKAFGQDRFRVLWFDDLVSNPRSFIQEFSHFCDIPNHEFALEGGTAINQSSRGFDIPDVVRAELYEIFRPDMARLGAMLTSDIPLGWDRLHRTQLGITS